MPLVQIIQSQLTWDSTNSVAWHVNFNPNMTFRIKILEDQSFGKCLPQLVKGLLSVKD